MYDDGQKTPSGKNPKGTVTVESIQGRLRLRFRFNGERYTVSLGLADTPANKRVAEAKAQRIEDDLRLQIAYGGNYFDPTLKKYKLQTVLSVSDPDIKPKPIPKLKDIWERYVNYKLPKASPKTINGTYEPVTSYLEKCETNGLQDALEFREELLKVTTPGQVRRALMQLSACCKWASQHGLIEKNPFDGMYKELPPTVPAPPISFTVLERDAIISAFESHKGKGMNYKHYAPFVKFLFWMLYFHEFGTGFTANFGRSKPINSDRR